MKIFSTFLTIAKHKRYFSQKSSLKSNLIVDSVVNLCKKYPAKYWRDLEVSKKYPSEFVEELTRAGYLALLIPEKYGGSGLDILTACSVLETIHSTGCNGAAAHAQMYTMATILNHGSEEQKNKYLPRIASGNLRLQAFGVSEPNSGTDTLSLETKATRLPEGGWVINGVKLWTSRAEYSDLMLLLARTSEASGLNGLSVFIVDMQQAKKQGLSIKKIDTSVNHNTCEVHFEQVKLPDDAIIGMEGHGLKYILDSMNAERILIAAECLGDCEYFIKRMTEYASERIVFGRPIGMNQGVQFPIAQSYAQTEAAKLVVREAASYFDNIIEIPTKEERLEMGRLANLAKLLASEASWKCADNCMQTFGGFAFATEYGIERKWRETRLYRTAPISTNLIYSYLAEKILGLPRSY